MGEAIILLIGLSLAGGLVFLSLGARAPQGIPRWLRDLAVRFSVALVVVSVVVLGLLWLIVMQSGVPEPILPALISVCALAVGWIVTFGFREYERGREKAEARRDLLLALRSEIFTAMQTLDDTDVAGDAQIVQDRIRKGGDRTGAYFPFSASESPPIVFRGLSAQITALDAREIGHILRFYAAQTDLSTLVEDCRGPAFATLSAERRIAVHRRLTATRLAALFWAVQAVYQINRSLDVGNPEDLPRSGRNPSVVIVKDVKP